MEPLLLYLDAVTVPVPDLDEGIAFYYGVLGHDLFWRDDATGQGGLSMPQSSTEVPQFKWTPDRLTAGSAERMSTNGNDEKEVHPRVQDRRGTPSDRHR
jgi:catechol 2,3-dioxygenase-like lactoylglutathione lyase family enzyme